MSKELAQGAEVPAKTFALLKRQLQKISKCPCAMCSDCIEILGNDVQPIVDSLIRRRALSTPAHQSVSEGAHDNKAAIELLDKWLTQPESVDSGFSERLHQLIDENRLSDRQCWPSISEQVHPPVPHDTIMCPTCDAFLCSWANCPAHNQHSEGIHRAYNADKISEQAQRAAAKIVGPFSFKGTFECPWCIAHPHREPCTFECGEARSLKKKHEEQTAKVAAIIEEEFGKSG